MSKQYKQSMDKIVVSDALKAKIMKAAEERLADDEAAQKAESREPKRTKAFYFRRAASAAACVIVCLTAVYMTKNIGTDKILPQIQEPNIRYGENEDANNVKKSDNTAAAEETGQGSAQGVQNSDKNHDSSDAAASGAEKVGKSTNAIVRPPADSKDSDKNADNEKNSADGSVKDSEVVKSDVPNGGEAAVGSAADAEDKDSDNPLLSAAPSESGSIAELRELAGYDFKIPTYITKGYLADEATLMFGELIQIVFRSAEGGTITYRTEQGSGDISGDYNVYDTEETVCISENSVTLKGAEGKFCLAVWEDGESAYALSLSEGAEKEEIIKIIGGISFED